MGSWNIIEISRPAICCISFLGSLRISRPPKSTSPPYWVLDSSCRRRMVLAVIVLPQPLSPTKPCISPFRSVRSMPRTACTTPFMDIRSTLRFFRTSTSTIAGNRQFLPFFESRQLALGRVQIHLQAVAQDIEGNHGNDDRDPRSYGHDGAGAQEDAALLQHGSPVRSGGLDSQSEEAQGREVQYGIADVEGEPAWSRRSSEGCAGIGYGCPSIRWNGPTRRRCCVFRSGSMNEPAGISWAHRRCPAPEWRS